MKKTKRYSNKTYYLIPLFLIVLIIPIIVRLKVVTLDDVTYEYWTGQRENADFFSYYKAVWLIIFSLALLFSLTYKKCKKELIIKKQHAYYIPIIVYAVAIIISTIFSKYGVIALKGFADRYEGMYVLLAYLIVLFSSINLIDSEKDIKYVIGCLFVSALVLGTIGIFQYFGYDLFRSQFGKMLLLPQEYWGAELSFTFGKNTIYSTLYNTNYVGSYMAMLLPLAFAAFIYYDNSKLKIAMGIFTCLMFANWIGCKSRTGYVGGAIAMLVLAVIYRKKIIKNLKSVLPLLAGFLLIFIVMDYSANKELSKRIIYTVRDIYGKDKAYSNAQYVNKPMLEDIVFSDKKALIKYGEQTLTLKLDGNNVTFWDDDGNNLKFISDEEGNLLFEDNRYSEYLINIDQAENEIKMKLNDMEFSFIVTPDGFYISGEKGILINKIEHAEQVCFKGRERFGSGRGFIWSRSIALLKNNILIGGGPDTFVIQFPQHDYVGKLNAFGTVKKIVDKPHNMYLMIGINTGVVSLVAFVFILAVYFLSSSKIYFSRNIENDMDFIGAAIFTAILGYAIAGLGNDSTVSVAPVFWTLLGLGISCNYILKEKKKVTVINSKENETAVNGNKTANKPGLFRGQKKEMK